MERFSAKPSASIPEACDNWTETRAAYRFLGNDDVQWQAVLALPWAGTKERIRMHAVVVCIQDTTELDFNGQETAGMGPLSYEAQRGMYLHATYAVTVDPAVPFTNNLGERAIRMPKVKQKISGSFRTLLGAQNFCVIRSCLDTLRKQCHGMLAVLQCAFAGDPIQPACG